MAGRYAIRPASAADVRDVSAIELAVFSDPWSAHDFAECVSSDVPFLVAEEHGTVAGYVVAHHAADEGEILNLGVATAHRRQGLGRALVEGVVAMLAGRGVPGVWRGGTPGALLPPAGGGRGRSPGCHSSTRGVCKTLAQVAYL